MLFIKKPFAAPIYVSRGSVRFGNAPNFPVPLNGSVASRISEFEKRPGAPNLLQIACALNGTAGKTEVMQKINNIFTKFYQKYSVSRLILGWQK